MLNKNLKKILHTTVQTLLQFQKNMIINVKAWLYKWKKCEIIFTGLCCTQIYKIYTVLRKKTYGFKYVKVLSNTIYFIHMRWVPWRQILWMWIMQQDNIIRFISIKYKYMKKFTSQWRAVNVWNVGNAFDCLSYFQRHNHS